MADPRKTVIGIGELLWDCFGDSKRPGGAPANVAFHAGQLGAEGIICSRVGDDDLGTQLVSYIEQRGLSTRYIQRDPQHPTGTVTVNTARPDHPEYTIHEDVAWDHMTFDEDWSAVLATASAVCFGTLAQRSPTSRRTITQALDRATDALLVYDVNLRPPFWSRELIESSLHRADVVKLNIDEVSVLARLLAPDADSPGSLSEFLVHNYDLRLVCVTRGAQGCLVVSPNETVDVAGRRVTAADAVGAGDAFTAALVWGLLQEWRLRAVAGFANEVGALVASRHGAMPVLRDEFTALQTAILGDAGDMRRA